MGTRLTIPCAKCTRPIEVDEQTINNAAALGIPLTVEHDVCPSDPVPVADPTSLRRFRVQFLVVELPTDPELGDVEPKFPDLLYGGVAVETLLGTGLTAEGRNLAEVVNGPFTTWLNRTWPKVQENAAFADLPAPTPAPTE